jgi:hypothetical protein
MWSMTLDVRKVLPAPAKAVSRRSLKGVTDREGILTETLKPQDHRRTGVFPFQESLVLQ